MKNYTIKSRKAICWTDYVKFICLSFLIKAFILISPSFNHSFAYAKNKIYFSSDVCKKIDIINDTFFKAWIKFETYKPYESNRGINENEKYDAWHKSWNIISKEIPPIKEDLEKEFRNMLGVK